MKFLRRAAFLSILVSALSLPSSVRADRWAEFKKRSGQAWGAVKDEVSLWPSMAYNFPSAYWETAKDGSQIRSLSSKGKAIGNVVVEEAKFAPQWLPSLPGAYIETAADGRQLSSLRGGVTGFSDRGSFGLARIDTQPYANTPEHQQAWNGGHRVGEATFDEMALTLATAGMARGGSAALKQGQRGLAYAGQRYNKLRGVQAPTGPAHSRYLHELYLEELRIRERLSRTANGAHEVPPELQRMAAQNVRPRDLRYSQSTVQPSVRDLEASMRSNGWQGDAIDAVRMPDGRLTVLDNRRTMAAQGAELPRIPVRIHKPGAKLPEAYLGRQPGAETFGDLLRGRMQGQGAGFPGQGNFVQPQIAVVTPTGMTPYQGAVLKKLPTSSWTIASRDAVVRDSMRLGMQEVYLHKFRDKEEPAPPAVLPATPSVENSGNSLFGMDP